jgi:hypothetical protein
MSTINSWRDVGHGVGGGHASINNVAFSVGGWCGWLTDDDAFFVDGADGWVPAIYSQGSKQFRRAITDESNPLFGAAINTGFAGGGVWAGWRGAQRPDDPQRGLFTSTGLHLPDAGLLAVGPAGELGFKPSYQSAGPCMLLERAGQERVAAFSAPGVAPGSPEALAALEPALRAEGLYWQLSAGSPYDLQLLGADRAIWQEGQRIKVVGIPQPLQLGRAWGPRAHLIDGRWWVSYYSDISGIVLHPFDELNGITVVPPGVDAWHSARAFGSEVLFALFATEAEAPGWLRPVTVETAGGGLKPLEPPKAALVLPKPTRKYWSGWFEFASSPAGPGNSMLAVRHIAGALNRPAIVTDETEHLVSGTLLGRFIAGNSVEQIEEAARASKLRPVAYWDDNAWPRWPELPNGSWLCIRLYCPKGMSLGVFKAQSRSIIHAAPAGVPLVLVGQQYSSNADLVGFVEPSLPAPHDSEALKPLAQALVELANENTSVVMLLLFSGYGRRGGLMDHPDLVEPWQIWSAQLQAPTLEAYPPAPSPVDPPKPKPSPFLKHKEYRMSTDKQNVAIVGPAGLYGRPNKPNTGPWGSLKDDAGKPRNWRGVIWDGVKDASGAIKSNKDPKASSADYQFELTLPDGRHSLYHAGADGFFGADATANAVSPGSDQFYIKPAAETRGAFEAPVIYEGSVTPKLLSGQVEYVANDGKGPAFVSCGFAVEVLS